MVAIDELSCRDVDRVREKSDQLHEICRPDSNRAAPALSARASRMSLSRRSELSSLLGEKATQRCEGFGWCFDEGFVSDIRQDARLAAR